MSGFMIFMICWLAFCALIFGAATGIFWFDRLAVIVLRLIDAPLYPEARMVASLIYQHPEQWKASSYSMEHPKVGSINGGSALTIDIQGSFGKWQPNAIERRIIFTAMHWYRTHYMKQRLAQALGAHP